MFGRKKPVVTIFGQSPQLGKIITSTCAATFARRMENFDLVKKSFQKGFLFPEKVSTHPECPEIFLEPSVL